jgi:hypothetical protein
MPLLCIQGNSQAVYRLFIYIACLFVPVNEMNRSVRVAKEVTMTYLMSYYEILVWTD